MRESVESIFSFLFFLLCGNWKEKLFSFGISEIGVSKSEEEREKERVSVRERGKRSQLEREREKESVRAREGVSE